MSNTGEVSQCSFSLATFSLLSLTQFKHSFSINIVERGGRVTASCLTWFIRVAVYNCWDSFCLHHITKMSSTLSVNAPDAEQIRLSHLEVWDLVWRHAGREMRRPTPLIVVIWSKSVPDFHLLWIASIVTRPPSNHGRWTVKEHASYRGFAGSCCKRIKLSRSFLSYLNNPYLSFMKWNVIRACWDTRSFSGSTRNQDEKENFIFFKAIMHKRIYVLNKAYMLKSFPSILGTFPMNSDRRIWERLRYSSKITEGDPSVLIVYIIHKIFENLITIFLSGCTSLWNTTATYNSKLTDNS